MKTTNLMALAVASLGLLLFSSATQAKADHQNSNSAYHIDQLARRAQRQANRVVWQVRQIPGYGPRVQQLRRQAFQCQRMANRIHRITHNAANFTGRRGQRSGFVGNGRFVGIRGQLRQLDRKMHQMQDDVRFMRSNILARQPRYGLPGSAHVSQHDHDPGIRVPDYRNRQGNGRFRRRLAALNRLGVSLRGMDNTVHHLIRDTGGRRLRSFDNVDPTLPDATAGRPGRRQARSP